MIDWLIDWLIEHTCDLFQFEEAVGSLPDSKLPVANQLEQAITTIRKNVKIILDTQAESKHLKQVLQISLFISLFSVWLGMSDKNGSISS